MASDASQRNENLFISNPPDNEFDDIKNDALVKSNSPSLDGRGLGGG
jgi:hypothetical protein